MKIDDEAKLSCHQCKWWKWYNEVEEAKETKKMIAGIFEEDGKGQSFTNFLKSMYKLPFYCQTMHFECCMLIHFKRCMYRIEWTIFKEIK